MTMSAAFFFFVGLPVLVPLAGVESEGLDELGILVEIASRERALKLEGALGGCITGSPGSFEGPAVSVGRLLRDLVPCDGNSTDAASKGSGVLFLRGLPGILVTTFKPRLPRG